MLLERARKLIRRNAARLDRLAASVAVADPLERFREDPATMFAAAGIVPDAWQRDALRSTAPRSTWRVHRQGGKSSTAAFIALREAMLTPNATVLLISPSLRQSGELFRRTTTAFDRIGRPIGVRAESALRIEFANGSRIVSLPGTEATVRGFTAQAVIVDEYSRIRDEMLAAVRPMLSTTGGRLLLISTPWGRTGAFWDSWNGNEAEWERVLVTADQCPRISAEFLASERRALGERIWMCEYFCEWLSASDCVFDMDVIRGSLNSDLAPLEVFQ